jgi:hypothetical protein
MGNVPNSGIDPDGGFCTTCFQPLFDVLTDPVFLAKLSGDIILSGIVKTAARTWDNVANAALRTGLLIANGARNTLEGTTTIVNGINKSFFGDLVPDYGGHTEYANSLREMGQNVGYAAQAGATMGMGTPSPGGNPAYATPNGRTVPATQPASPAVTAKDANGRVHANGKVGSNAKKMSSNEIGEFLGEGENWHQTSAKRDFLSKFKKQLRGDTNADFYIDKGTGQVLLYSNKSKIWIETGQFIKF